jgi:hypothetical protein
MTILSSPMNRIRRKPSLGLTVIGLHRAVRVLLEVVASLG